MQKYLCVKVVTSKLSLGNQASVMAMFFYPLTFSCFAPIHQYLMVDRS